MPDENIYLKREQELALRTHMRNREDLINFYKSLGQQSKKKIPKEMKEDEERFKGIAEAQERMEGRIKAFAKASPEMSQGEADVAVGRLAIAMFLLDRTKKLRELALKGSVSVYSVYVSLRNAACGTLSDPYYAKGPEEVLGDYLDIEPLLTACSELCGLSTPPLEEMLAAYKEELAKELEKS